MKYYDQEYLLWNWTLASEFNIEWRTERAWLRSVGINPNLYVN